MNKLTFPILAMTLLLVSSAFAQRETFFSTGFEYDEEPFVIEPDELNGANDQVGTWSGDEFPEAVGGDILEQPDSVGFADNPYGGRLLLVDRPGGDLDTGADFQGSYFADLTESILLLGAEVSFDVGTRRTQSDNTKDYDVVGRDSNGDETFRLRIGTNNNGGQRLGVVTNEGADVLFDLPTVEGSDAGEDLDNTGGFPLAVNDQIASVKVQLAESGYAIAFATHEQNTSGRANSYLTDTIAFNGAGVDLTQVEFTYSGAGATGRNSGYVVDNVLVTGFTEFLQGDFNQDGILDVADFNLLAENFGTSSSIGDFDFNGVVDLYDFVGLKTAYNSQGQAATAAVPEPTGIVLLLTGFLGLLVRRRRK